MWQLHLKVEARPRSFFFKKKSGRPGEMNDKRLETVFGKSVSCNPTPQKSRAMIEWSTRKQAGGQDPQCSCVETMMWRAN